MAAETGASTLQEGNDLAKVSPALAMEAWGILQRIRRERPLVHHISNAVTANLVANATLAIGGRPIMAQAPEEVREVAASSSVLVINMGVPDRAKAEVMLLAGRAANNAGVPVVLDPVGVGFTRFRTEIVREILRNVHVSVVRGNVAEIASLAGLGEGPSGVDSGIATEWLPSASKIAVEASSRLGTVVAITGRVDCVADGTGVWELHNGHELLTHVTGAGCLSSAAVGVFSAAHGDYGLAAACALACTGVAAERAAIRCCGPASLQTAWLDELMSLEQGDLMQGVRSCYTGAQVI